RRRGVPGAARGGPQTEGARGLRQRGVRQGGVRAVLAGGGRGRGGQRGARQEAGAREFRPARGGAASWTPRHTRPSWRANRSRIGPRFDLPEDTTTTSSASVAGGATGLLAPTDLFPPRHIGPSDAEIAEMLATLGLGSLAALVAETVPDAIRLKAPLDLPPARGEREVLEALRSRAARNQVFR